MHSLQIALLTKGKEASSKKASQLSFVPGLQNKATLPLPHMCDHRTSSETVLSQPFATSLLQPVAARQPLSAGLLSPHLSMDQTSVSPILSCTEASEKVPVQRMPPSLGRFDSWLTSPKDKASSCTLPSARVSALQQLANAVVQRCTSSSQQHDLSAFSCQDLSIACSTCERPPCLQSNAQQSFCPQNTKGALIYACVEQALLAIFSDLQNHQACQRWTETFKLYFSIIAQCFQAIL